LSTIIRQPNAAPISVWTINSTPVSFARTPAISSNTTIIPAAVQIAALTAFASVAPATHHTSSDTIGIAAPARIGASWSIDPASSRALSRLPVSIRWEADSA
jgi:hypothetical protein